MTIDPYISERMEVEDIDQEEAERRTLVDILEPIIGQKAAIEDVYGATSGQST